MYDRRIGKLYAWVEKAKVSSVQIVADVSNAVNHVNAKSLIDENRELKKHLFRFE